MNKKEKNTILDIYRGILVEIHLIGLDKEDSKMEFTRLLDLLGLKEENIIDCGICSVCNSDLIHSFRVEKEGYGLGTAIIELK